MAGIAVLADRPRLPIRAVRPYVGRLHTSITILAVRHGMAVQVVGHEGELPQLAPWVLDEVPCRIQILYDVERLTD